MSEHTTTSTAMSAARSTRERQLQRPKKTPPPSLGSFFSNNKSSSANLRSRKPAEMPNPAPPAKARRSKRYAVRNRSNSHIVTVVPGPKIEEVPITPVTPTSPIERPDVFAFLEEEQADETVPEPDHVDDTDEEGTVEEEEDEGSSQAPPYPNSSPARSEADASGNSQRTRVEEYILQASSFHSDSGISMGSGSSEYGSPVLSYKVPHMTSPCTRAKEADAVQPTGTTTWVKKEKDVASGREADVEPEAFYASARQLPIATSRQRPADDRRPSVPRSSRQEARGSKAQPGYIRKGYDLLASNISSNNTTVLKPLYRRFEAFNNRILLYLQDEITEMEEELRELDNAIARESEAMGIKVASRRGEVLPSQLQWRRLELLARSFAKIEQYSKLKSSSKTFTSI